MPAPSETSPSHRLPGRAAHLAVHQTPAAAPRPRVVTFQLGREFRLGGRRLGLLGSTALHVECACGHSGRVSVAGLVAKHGSEARVRDAVRSIRCGNCGKQHIKEIRWVG